MYQQTLNKEQLEVEMSHLKSKFISVIEQFNKIQPDFNIKAILAVLVSVSADLAISHLGREQAAELLHASVDNFIPSEKNSH